MGKKGATDRLISGALTMKRTERGGVHLGGSLGKGKDETEKHSRFSPYDIETSKGDLFSMRANIWGT